MFADVSNARRPRKTCCAGRPQIVKRPRINIGKERGIRIVAEGVETREQAQFLHRHGCAIGQGYLFRQPGTEMEIGRLIHAQVQAQASGLH